MILWIIILTFTTYLFYTRIWVVYSKIHFYKKQGVPFHSGIYPALGSFVNMIPMIKSNTTSQSIISHFIEETYLKGKKEVPPFVGIVLGTSV